MEQFYLGIDVSKGYADFIIIDVHKQIVESPFQLDDTFVGHVHLSQFFTTFFAVHQNAILYAAVESTGGYENNWYRTLRKLQAYHTLQVTRLNPKGVSHHGKAAMKRITTDRVAARTIAEYLIDHHNTIIYDEHDYFSALRSQWTYLKMLTKQETQLINQVHAMLYKAHPELVQYCKNGLSQWLLKLLAHYPTAGELARAPAEDVANIPYISKTKARTLIAHAQQSIASATDPVHAMVIQSMASEILHRRRLIRTQESLLAQQCTLPEVALLTTYQGIDYTSAIGLLIEIGTVQRFASVKKLASFFGLHPTFKESGDGTYGIRMSKAGRKQPRAILYMVVLSALSCNPVIKELFAYHCARGKSKMAAIGICMHKTLRIVYGMLKTNTPFNPEIDRKNREKQKETTTQLNTTKRLRRYQAPDEVAPISRKQNKKRKEQVLSQDELVIKHEIDIPTLSSV